MAHDIMNVREHLVIERPAPCRVVMHEISSKTPNPALPPVFMVHGLTRNASDFLAVGEALAREGYRTYAPDMPGRGESEYYKDPVLYNYTTYQHVVSTLMRAKGLQEAVFLGTSMGGIIGMTLASMQAGGSDKERLIRTLIVNDIGPLFPAEAMERVTKSAENFPLFDSREDAEAHYHKKLKPFRISVDFEERLREHAFVTDLGKIKYTYDSGIGRAIRASLIEKNSVGTAVDRVMLGIWERIDVPVYVLRGGDSDVLTEETLDVMRTLPTFKGAAVYEGVGHCPALDVPDQIEHVISMVAGVYAEAA